MRLPLTLFALPWLSAAWGAAAAEPPDKTEALVAPSGEITLSRGGITLCVLQPGLFEQGWKLGKTTSDLTHTDLISPLRRFVLRAPGGASVAGEVTLRAKAPDGLSLEYRFTPGADVTLNSLHVSADFPVAALAGGKWVADDKKGVFPAEFGEAGLFNAAVRKLALEPSAGAALTLSFSAATPVLLQDNRRWGPQFSVRIGPGSGEGQLFKKGVPARLAFVLHCEGGLAVVSDQPVTLAAGDEWIPLKVDLDIQPGSALDFSKQGFHDAPAGKYGWLRARPDGQFAFAQRLEQRQRFYGVNLCFSAQYLTHEQADKLAERLQRLGYNAVRIHHYERELIQGQANSITLNPEKIEQLDYLLAALIQRGIYLTTDLYVSRPVKPEELGLKADEPGKKARTEYKVLVPVNPKAFANWQAFARALLTHVNPYTKRSYAQEPALAWLSLINEGNLGNDWGAIRSIPDWSAAWNRWLARRYAARAGLAAAWGEDLKPQEDAAQGTVALPNGLNGAGARARDALVFLAWTERDFMERAGAFLHKELGVQALLTNMNGWTNHTTDQAARLTFDYVDDHFYVDHPQFLEQDWRLPSRCPNTSPIAGGAAGGRQVAFTRLFGKPFTLTEYNYSAPGRYRGVGGILTGALGALQDWDGIWRFAYSHSRENLFQPGRLGYFDMATDPLGQAAERASLCLFLRGDARAAPHQALLTLFSGALEGPAGAVARLAPPPTWLAWITRVGCRVREQGEARPPALEFFRAPHSPGPPANALNPYAAEDAAVMKLMRQGAWLSAENRTDPAQHILQSETQQITIDGPRNILILDTPRTAGGFAPVGQSLTTNAGVTVTMEGTDATVWVSALDDQPLATSRHMLVTHLTDVQNTGIKYAERARQTLLDWGQLPHLVRAGRATVRVALKTPGPCRVYALGTSGQRLFEVPATLAGQSIAFCADVAAQAPAHGAVMLYEIVRE